MHPLYVAFVWHMHQPYYRDLRTGEIPLPWVRLHATKDYLHMGEALARHPAMHVTINMVPSLTEQMLAWAEGGDGGAGAADDDLWRLAEQVTWTPDEKRRIINLCFSINWDKVIRRHPRYAELLDRRPQALADPEAFDDRDIRDLVVWFNLVWLDPGWRTRHPDIQRLVEKGRDFTRADLLAIHAAQRAIGREILPLYRRLAETGQLELITSPYYHPVLPLLADTDLARRASPGLPLPRPPFCAPEDAAAQLQMAVDAHVGHYAAAPAGLWPSEGGVAPEILPLVHLAGLTWLASDEAILSRSLGRPLDRDGSNLLVEPRLLYQPYRVLAGTEIGPYIVFRDHELADRIGFLYQHLPGQQAAEDMIYRLLEIRRRINDPETPYLVTIILDGENCWEHYEQNGDIFLDALYDGLSRRAELAPVTVSEFLRLRRQPAATLARLATGSWINGDLTTWIGDPEHNRAWAALRKTREHLVRRTGLTPRPPLLTTETDRSSGEREVDSGEGEVDSGEGGVGSGDEKTMTSPSPERSFPLRRGGRGVRSAWRALYAAEGSDWFWWYSHRNSSQQDALYDRLFRHSLAAVYEALGDPAPEWLAEPIQGPEAAGMVEHRPAQGYVSPLLTAAVYPGEAWAAAAQFRPASVSSGTMQRADAGSASGIARLFVGHDPRNLYLRLDLREPLDAYDAAIYLAGPDVTAAGQRVRAAYRFPDEPPPDLAVQWEVRREPGQAAPFLYRSDGRDGWAAVGPVAASLGERVLEATIPLAALGLTLEDTVRVLVVLAQDAAVVAQLPERAMGVVELGRF